MKIPILIETIEDQRFRASGGEPFAGAVEADTPEAALDELKKGIVARVTRGGRIEALDIPDDWNPWHEGFGMFRDDPLFHDWQQAISDNRRIVDDRAAGAWASTCSIPARCHCCNAATTWCANIPAAARSAAPYRRISTGYTFYGPPHTWEALCGQEGWLVLCGRCHRQIHSLTAMN